jgi:DNA-binding HxlR family transcriptional regulator
MRGKSGRNANGGKGCALGDLFGLLSQAHMLDILHVFLRAQGPMRFVELQDELKLSPNTLSARLKSLVAAGLLSRTSHNEIPPRVDYEATAKARDLKAVFESLDKWAGQNDLSPIVVAAARAKPQ